MCSIFFFFFKQKTAYEIYQCDWSSDVCSSDLQELIDELKAAGKEKALDTGLDVCARHIRQLKEDNICDGVHIMAIGMEDKVPVIMERAGL